MSFSIALLAGYTDGALLGDCYESTVFAAFRSNKRRYSAKRGYRGKLTEIRVEKAKRKPNGPSRSAFSSGNQR